jgi:integrase
MSVGLGTIATVTEIKVDHAQTLAKIQVFSELTESELAFLRQSNWRGKLLTVKSKASVRDLPLPPVPVNLLQQYRLRWRPNAFGLLFANAKGQPITSCYVRRDILHPIRERLGIPRGAFHAFRHGLGTALMQAGANARVVQ